MDIHFTQYWDLACDHQTKRVLNNNERSKVQNREEQWHNRNCTIISEKFNPLQCCGRGLFIPSTLLHHSSNVPSDISKGLEITTCVFLSISHVEVFDCTLHLDYAAHAVFTLTFRPNHPSSLAAVVYATTSTRWTFASRPSAPRSATQGSLSWETRRH